MLRGDLGQPPGGWPAALQKKVLKEAVPITARPGSLLKETDLAAVRAEAEKKVGRALSDDEFISYLMYPRVFTDFAAMIRKYGPVSALPTPAFFYGMAPGDELSVEIEAGKALNIRLTALGEIREDGTVEVFFELNGQPRVIVVPNRNVAASSLTRRKADEADDTHIGAPMPGSVASIAVRERQKVKAGDIIDTLEAMTMETALHAPRDGIVTELCVTAGVALEAKDLILILGPA
jgi:pyruvate carboxylase